MNRAERRRQKKAGIKVQKEPTLNLKVSDFDHMVSHAEKSAKERATAAAIHEIDRQILEHDEAYSLDIDAMVLWTLHVYLGFGKKRLERFYRDMLKEHIHMREVYEMDDTYPERYKLKELCNVDVEALNNEFKEVMSWKERWQSGVVYYDNIPEELKKLDQWVCANDGSKVPMKAWENEAASSTNPETWSDFETALESYNQHYYDYCGFVFADNGYVGIDIDEGYDEDGLMSVLGADIVGKCHSYTEKSRSGRGFHILLRGTLPFKGKNNLAGVEIYKAARYFIMTGNTLLYREIIENQEAIDYVVEKYFPEARETSDKVVVGRDKIYAPVWEEPVVNGRVKLRPVYPRIPDGSRNICLTSLAGMLHNQGYSKSQIYEELLYANTVACDPPLDRNELRTICNSVTRYKR